MTRFNGPDYDPVLDQVRLEGQIKRVWAAAYSDNYHTLGELARFTGDPEASVSAQLRHLRKDRFGGWIVEKRRRGEGKSGLWEYRVRDPKPASDLPMFPGL